MSRHFIKDSIQMGNKDMKRFAISFASFRKMQIKTMRYDCIPLRTAKIKNSDNQMLVRMQRN